MTIRFQSPNRRTLFIILAVAILLFAVGFFGYGYLSEAEVNIKDVAITNVSSGTATIIWTSDRPTKGIVYYGKNDVFSPLLPFIGKSVEYDDRSVTRDDEGNEVFVEGGPFESFTHHVTIEDLDPNTTYYFEISGRGMWVKSQDYKGTNLNLSMTTDPVYKELATPDPVFGRLIDQNGKSVADAIVTIVLVKANGQMSKTISATTNEIGSYSLDIANVSYIFPEEFDVNSDELFSRGDNIPIVRERITSITGPRYIDGSISPDVDNDQPTDIMILTEIKPEDRLPYVNSSAGLRLNSLISPSSAGISCGGGCCADGWCYGGDDNAPQASCAQRDADACVGHGAPGGSSDGGQTPPSEGDQPPSAADQDAPWNDPSCSGVATCGSLNWCRMYCGGNYIDVDLSLCAGQDCNLDGTKTGAGSAGSLPGYCNAYGCFPDGQTSSGLTCQEYCAESYGNSASCLESCASVPTPAGPETPAETCAAACASSVEECSRCYEDIEVPPTEEVLCESECASGDEIQCGRCYENLPDSGGDDIVDSCALPCSNTGTLDACRACRGEVAPISTLCNPDTLSDAEYESCVLGSVDDLCQSQCDASSGGDSCQLCRNGVLGAVLEAVQNGEAAYFGWTACEEDHVGTNTACTLVNGGTGVCGQTLAAGTPVCVVGQGEGEPLPGGVGIPTTPVETSPCYGKSINEMCEYTNYFGANITGVCQLNAASGGLSCAKNNPLGLNLEVCGETAAHNQSQCDADAGPGILEGHCEEVPGGLWTDDQICVEGPAETESSIDFSQNNTLTKLLTPVKASSGAGYTVEGDILKVDEPGVYTVTSDSFETLNAAPIWINKELNSDKIKFYDDANKNGTYDNGEKYLTELGEISLTKVSDIETYKLNKGWNLISFPGVTVSETAGALLSELDNQGSPITDIAKYENGKFEVVTYNNKNGNAYGNDFPLLPGRSYFVNSKVKKTVGVGVQRTTESVPVSLSTGWNLIGIISPTKSYTAESTLDSMQSQDIDADILSRFDSGIYQNVVKQDGVLYGNDFNVLDTEGYFLRVNQGGKTWKP